MKIVNTQTELSKEEKDFYNKSKLLAAGPILLFSCVILVKELNLILLNQPLWPITEHPNYFFSYLGFSFVWFVFFKASMKRKKNQQLLKNPLIGLTILTLSLALYMSAYYILNGLYYAFTIVLFPILITYSVSNFHNRSKPWFKIITYVVCLLVGLGWVYYNEFGPVIELNTIKDNALGFKSLRFNLMTGGVLGTFLSLGIRPILASLNKSTERAFSLIGTLGSYVAILLSYLIKVIQFLVEILQEDIEITTENGSGAQNLEGNQNQLDDNTGDSSESKSA